MTNNFIKSGRKHVYDKQIKYGVHTMLYAYMLIFRLVELGRISINVKKASFTIGRASSVDANCGQGWKDEALQYLLITKAQQRYQLFG